MKKRIVICSLLGLLMFAAVGMLSGSATPDAETRETVDNGNQQRLVRLTRYEGQRITGVEASSAFDVTLIRSDETKVVAEINEELEGSLRLTLRADGIVRVSMSNPPRVTRNHTQKLTVYLPELSYLKASGAATVRGSGHFTSYDTKIVLSGAADLKSLNLHATADLDIEISGAATGQLDCTANFLKCKASGAATLRMNVKCEEANVTCTSAADMTLEGKAGDATISTASAGELRAQKFNITNVNVTASGASTARIYVTGRMVGNASSAANIRFQGNPTSIDNKSSSGANIRPVN